MPSSCSRRRHAGSVCFYMFYVVFSIFQSFSERLGISQRHSVVLRISKSYYVLAKAFFCLFVSVLCLRRCSDAGHRLPRARRCEMNASGPPEMHSAHTRRSGQVEDAKSQHGLSLPARGERNEVVGHHQTDPCDQRADRKSTRLNSSHVKIS